jgi:hypothetical protein
VYGSSLRGQVTVFFDLVEFKLSLMRSCIKVTKKEDQDRPILQIK